MGLFQFMKERLLEQNAPTPPPPKFQKASDLVPHKRLDDPTLSEVEKDAIRHERLFRDDY